jgi:methylenetetrahydrofolate reductase (NADPH)
VLVSCGRFVRQCGCNKGFPFAELSIFNHSWKFVHSAKFSDFCIGVAGYPEKHYESPNPDLDMMFLKSKIDAGADYITTQMFFDNEKYHGFVKKCRDLNIDTPIIPGLKPLTSIKQLSAIPSFFLVDIPNDLALEMMKCKNDKDMELVGTEWLLAQTRDLIRAGAPVIHFYTLGKPHVVYNVMKQIL